MDPTSPDFGYQLCKALAGTLWEPDFLETVEAVLMDLVSWRGGRG